MDSTYPGSGACELCGQINPCDTCAGASPTLKFSQKLTKDLKVKTDPDKDSGKELK